MTRSSGGRTPGRRPASSRCPPTRSLTAGRPARGSRQRSSWGRSASSIGPRTARSFFDARSPSSRSRSSSAAFSSTRRPSRELGTTSRRRSGSFRAALASTSDTSNATATSTPTRARSSSTSGSTSSLRSASGSTRTCCRARGRRPASLSASAARPTLVARGTTGCSVAGVPPGVPHRARSRPAERSHAGGAPVPPQAGGVSQEQQRREGIRHRPVRGVAVDRGLLHSEAES